MKMINLLLPLMLISSCDKATYNSSRVVFSIGMSENRSRATGISEEDEKRINRWGIFLFRDGECSGYGINESSSDIELELDSGSYRCCAFVNYPLDFSPETIVSESRFWETINSLHGNTTTNFMMAGQQNLTITPGGINNVPITVKRLVAKIGINKITVSLTNPALRNLGFTLRGIYLTGSGGLMTGAMVSDTGLDTDISHGSSYTVPHCFYASPSGNVKLVIEASIGGTPCFYSLSFGSVLANHYYCVNEVIIRGYGKDGSPDNDSPEDEAQWIIDRNMWGETYSTFEIL